MKGLIAAACIAVIAFVGYFFWRELGISKSISEWTKSESDLLRQFRERQKQLLDEMPDYTDEPHKPITADDFRFNPQLPAPSPKEHPDLPR